MAAIPPKRITDRKACSDANKDDCALYRKMVERYGVLERTDGL